MKFRRRCSSCEKLDLHTIGWIFIIFETFVFYIFQHNSRLWVKTEQILTLGTVVIIVRARWIVGWWLWDGMKPLGWWRGCDLTKSKQLSSPLIFSLISSFSLLLQIKFSLMSKHISRKFQRSLRLMIYCANTNEWNRMFRRKIRLPTVSYFVI